VKSSGAFELVLAHSPVNATVVQGGSNLFAWGQLVPVTSSGLYAGRAVSQAARAGTTAPTRRRSSSSRLWRTPAADPAVVGQA
jgi:hypothetical protein